MNTSLSKVEVGEENRLGGDGQFCGELGDLTSKSELAGGKIFASAGARTRGTTSNFSGARELARDDCKLCSKCTKVLRNI